MFVSIIYQEIIALEGLLIFAIIIQILSLKINKQIIETKLNKNKLIKKGKKN
jgi:hypothetical protein